MTVLVNITFLETPTTITEKTQEQKCKDEICLEYYLSFSIISPLFHSISILSKLTKLLIVFCITLYVSEPSKCVVVFLFTLFYLKTFFICSYIQIFTELAARKCSVKKVFLHIFQNSLESTYARVSFFSQIAGLRENASCRIPLVAASVFKNVDFPNLENRVTHETKADNRSFYHRHICALCICIPQTAGNKLTRI